MEKEEPYDRNREREFEGQEHHYRDQRSLSGNYDDKRDPREGFSESGRESESWAKEYDRPRSLVC